MLAVGEVTALRGDRWTQQPDGIVFSTRDGTDPRTNGRLYAVHVPRLYGPVPGGAAFAGIVACLWLLARLITPKAPLATPAPTRSRLQFWAAGVLFAAGLYCNTGTLAPYGNTHGPWVDPDTEALFNADHEQFRKLFLFVDGAPRSEWDGALMLRRILFPLLAWPFMKIAGFELGGIIASMIVQLATFVFCVRWLDRRFGRGPAVAGAWLLALYPGTAYWAAMPYPYALIVPGSLLLMVGLHELTLATSWRRTCLISLLMGIGHLAYDFAPLWLPATAILLAWRRQWGWAAACGLQAAPLLGWLWFLACYAGQDPHNTNTAVYGALVEAYLSHGAAGSPGGGALFTTFWFVFFGANFFFLPALFLGAVALNRWTTRTAFTAAESSLLAVAALLFLFNNLAPPYAGAWMLRGSWIARLYQPTGAAMLFFLARWSGLSAARPIRAALVATAAGNALILFGPILRHPSRLAEDACYAFYAHADRGSLRPQEVILEYYGRRPLGFHRPPGPKPPA